MTTAYIILLMVSLALLASNVWTQGSMEGRPVGDQERDGFDYIPKHFFIRNSPDDPKFDTSGVPNYKVLNKVLGQLNIARAEQDERGFYERVAGSKGFNINSYPEYTESLPETESQRELRHLRRTQRHYSICRMERNFVPLNNEEYEYRPAYYEEIKCVKSEYDESSGGDGSVCSSLGFSCIQLNKTIHLTRRRYTSGCWESEARVILAGCECMSPDRFGDNMRLLSCTYNIEEKH